MEKEKELLIPKSLFDELIYAKENNYSDLQMQDVVNKILKDQMFQMLNDYPIPALYCMHLRQIVYPDSDTKYKPYQCINCKKYL